MRLMRFRPQFNRQLLAGKAKVGGDRAELGRMQFYLQDVCRNCNRSTVLIGCGGCRRGQFGLATGGNRINDVARGLADGLRGGRREVLLADHRCARGAGLFQDGA